jgi:peptidoglycan-associated lipoprotein
MYTRSHSSVFGVLVVGTILGAVFGYAGCKPDYPACESDGDCKPREFCVNRKCQQCRDNRDCPPGSSCGAGRCSPIAGYCSDKSQCPPGQECLGNRCRPCAADTECPTGMKCVQGACRKPQCSTDEQCAQDQECRNGFCVSARPRTAAGPPCQLESVYFDFDRATLTNEATTALGNNAGCLKRSDRPVNLVGRADARGTPEYNMALSDRRSQAVKDYLQRMGIPVPRLVPVPRGELDAAGADEAGWARDRRVDAEWQ